MDNYSPVHSMTAFFTPYCKNNNSILRLPMLGMAFLLLACMSLAWANTSNLLIKSAELQPVDDAYVLHANFDVNFSAVVEEALNKGIPLTFLIEFQVVSPRRYWFDDEVTTVSTQVVLSYHALSRQYLVNRENHQDIFTSLQEAKEDLAHLRDWMVLEKSLLKKGEPYAAALRIRLDQSQLPKPLQVEAMGSESWNMVSQRYRWIPVFSL